MFQTIKSQVPLLDVIIKDTGLQFKQSGENFIIEDEVEQGGCPFCGHKDCFKVKTKGEGDTEGMFKCFSCDEKGDVISWRAKRKKITLVEAIHELAKEYEIKLPREFSPVQQVFQLAAGYYEACMHETCDIGYPELNRLTPLQYQTTVRNHDVNMLKQLHVGWSDGGLIDYLTSIGIDDEIIEQSGLRNKKTGRDFLPARCFIYPHYIKGKVSHFTFKDPTKRMAFQLPKKFSLNNWTFYGQDSIEKAETVIVVEGENDLISVMESGQAPAVIATIGQISSDQLQWMRDNLGHKKVLTMFDPDEAGWKYRVKVEKNRRYFKVLGHVLPPEDKDVDELLKSGRTLTSLITKETMVQVDVNMFEDKPQAQDIDVPWEASSTTPIVTEERVVSHESGQIEPSKTLKSEESSAKDALKASGLSLPGESNEIEDSAKSIDQSTDEADCGSSKVVQFKNSYYRCKFKDGVPSYIPISDFVLKLVNVFVDEAEGRQREVVIIRNDGYKSRPFMVDDSTKVTVKNFRVLAAKMADATFSGTDDELSAVWKLVFSKSSQAEVNLPIIVGRHEGYKAWIFRNKLILDNGDVIDPDENGIFWLRGRSKGIRPVKLSREEGGTSDDDSDIPSLVTDIDEEEKDFLLKGVIYNVGKNLNSVGKALTMIAWTYASVYSNLIFNMNRGFPFLFLWGVNGQGKTTVAKWMTQDFFGINGHGSTSVPMLNTGIGWGRKSEYYASIPLFIDEIRSDEQTRNKLGVFRSYYDREARTVADRDSRGVKNIRPKAVFVFNGEDQFEDPATRERCIPVRIPIKDRELQESYRWMEDHKHLFTGILFHWIKEFTEVMSDPDKVQALKAEIRALDKELHKAGCSQRTSKNWAAIGVFGIRLAEKYADGFDFKQYLIKASTEEARYQKADTTLMQFWERVEGCCAQDNSKITDRHIMRDGNFLHVWYSEMFKQVQDDARGKFPFSKNAVLSALREEPYFVSDDKKVSMGIDGTRRVVVTLDLTKAPDSVRNIAQAN